MEEPRKTLEELKALRVIDLRKMLSELGLPGSGVKAELVARLDSYYEQMYSAGGQQGGGEDESAENSEMDTEEGVAEVDEDNSEEEEAESNDAESVQLEEESRDVSAQDEEESRDVSAQDEEESRDVSAQDEEESRDVSAQDEEESRDVSVQEGEESRDVEEVQDEDSNSQEAAEAERQRIAEAEKQERLRAKAEAVAQRAQQAEKQRLLAQKQAEYEERLKIEAQEKAQAEAEAENQRILAQQKAEEEAEKQRILQAQQEQQRLEQQKQFEAKQQAEIQAKKEQAAMEAEKQREIRERQIEAENLRQIEAEKQRQIMAEQQRKIEAEKQRQIEAEKQRQIEAEKQRQILAEKKRQMEAEVLRQEELQKAELQRQREAENLRQIEAEKEAKMEEEIEPTTPALFKHQIAPKPQFASQAGPPPASDDLEASPKKSAPVSLMSLNVEMPETSEEKLAPQTRDVKLPQGLEEVLAFKSKWATQQGHEPSDIARVEAEGVVFQPDQIQVQQAEMKKVPTLQKPVQLVEGMDDDDKSKGKKKNKKKKKKKNRPEEWARQAAEAERRRTEAEEAAKNAENTTDVEVEYIQEKLELDMSDPAYRQFSRIFEAFKIQDADDESAAIAVKNQIEAEKEMQTEELKKVPKLLEADDMIEDKDEEEGEDGDKKLSKRKLKKLNRLSVAELKQLVTRPDVVEMHDVTAKDPGLLVHLKSIRNTVPVPRHWCFKRKYLQGKRGIEKPPFDLPEFIKKTGIMEMRAALQEKEEAKGMKSKMREKVRPKLGKIDIDYQKLHDAFFKWQTKPRMTYHGDLYYEGKEFEIRLKEKKPGDLTDDLRTALGMPVGPNAHKVPPPWLISMQRYGPPPSYPNLKIPGLNAPIPEGCSFGYHAGGWGKPPVDETGKPLYGDVFGTSDSGYSQQIHVEEVDQTLWGEMESESEEEESSEEEEEEEEELEAPDTSGMQTPIVDAGMATPSGMSSVGAPGQETPELIELRKRRIEQDMEGGETPNLYTILPEKKNDRMGAGMMGSTHTYDLPGAIPAAKRLDPGAVEMALNPEEVDMMDSDALQAKAEAAMREKQASLANEDLSDMVAEHAAKQSNKRKRQAGKEKEGGGANKKYKEFKF